MTSPAVRQVVATALDQWTIDKTNWRERRRQAKELRAMGWSLQKIATHLGVSRQRIHQILKRLAASE